MPPRRPEVPQGVPCFYEFAKREVGDRFAELMIKVMPPEPERLATKDDLAVLSSDLRAEMADLRTELNSEIAGLRVEMRDLTGQQTRTLTVGLVGSITALTITQLILGVID